MSTIKDVAQRAGVSIATVSYVLNGTKTVTPKTRRKVMDAVKALNYAPNPTARSFKTGKKRTIAFIIPDISNNYFAGITKAVDELLQEHGYSLILSNTNEDPEQEIRQLRHLTSGIADGLILASTAAGFSQIRGAIPDDFPVVLIDRRLQDCPYDIITSSDRSAICSGIRVLAQKGHRRIGYIGDLPRLSTARERLAAFRDAMQQLSLPLEEDLIVQASSLDHSAYGKTGDLLARGCTAIVAGNNIITLDACSYVLHHAKSGAVPVLGYQHKDMPPLFYADAGVIALNEADLGRAAGEQILRRIKNPDAAQQEIVISNAYIRTDVQ
ncbi:MAG: LacI family DNA-binding transcriptional regulator [Lachnospiraceae bacterium]|jgi:LacI family transcriptional regulator